ncbi:MAG: lipopolysaccharide heptosyltransferase II [Pirellulales bacterium]|nr:lipopolysaccharide heptosyltransferase II [Pirellulales bacterium]
MRLGVFLPNWVGDVVMATPTLRAVRKFVGCEGRVVGIARPYVADVLAGTNWLDDFILYEKPTTWLGLSRDGILEKLQAANLDCIVLLTNSLRTAFMAWRSGATRRIGVPCQWRSLLLTECVLLPRAADGGLPATVDGYLLLANALGCQAESPALELATTKEDEAAADAAWHALGLPAEGPVTILNSGGAFGSSKQWPTEHFAELARRLVHELGHSVLVNCGPAERKIAHRIATLAGDPRVVSLAERDQLPVGLTKACIRRSQLLVTTDSGPRYFGVAFNKPVVTLFGPTDPVRTALHYDREACLSLGLECQPCMKRICPLGHHRCMRDLSVEFVFSALKELLSRRSFESVR